MTDALAALRARWADAPSLDDTELDAMLPRDACAYHDQTSRLIAEVLIARAEVARLTQEIEEWRCVDHSWRAAWRGAWQGSGDPQWGRELWLAAFLVGAGWTADD